MDEKDLLLSSYDYELPPHLIADRPAEGRVSSRLLVFNAKNNEIIHTYFYDLDKYLPSDSLMVLNQSKVFPCRLIGNKSSGGKVEVFFLEAYENEMECYKVLIKSNGKKKVGDKYFFTDGLELELDFINNENFYVKSNIEDMFSYLNEYAKIPIPPYIRDGESDEKDREDYQTVFAKEVGSVAAPTAGLHFTEETFKKLNSKNIEQAMVTLHVGLGTFAPVKVDNLAEHKMHKERFYIEDNHWQKIKQAKKRIAVGTTSLRTLESVWQRDLEAFRPDAIQETDIFIHPGKTVESIDALVTNFHLPKSTLLMLVSSLIGREKTLELYREAIEKEYRFFSYGDAMLILR